MHMERSFIFSLGVRRMENKYQSWKDNPNSWKDYTVYIYTIYGSTFSAHWKLYETKWGYVNSATSLKKSDKIW
jgi:hypothetical protein